MTAPQNILIVRTDRIGDVVLSLPMAKIIKKRYPNCKITFMLREYTKPLAVTNSFIDEILLLKEKNGKTTIWENVSLVKAKKLDTCFVVYPTFEIALFLFLSRIKKRIGTGYRWYSLLFNKRIYEHRKHGRFHELEHNVKMLKMIGIDENVSPENVSFNIQSCAESRQKVDEISNEYNINFLLPTVIIHPGSGGSSVDLPLLLFKKIVELLARELNINILITGSKSEYGMCNQLVINSKIINLAGRFDLSGMIALIEKSKLMIANSTGPIHIAAALGKYVIGFYPKIMECSQKRWGPFTNKKKIFEPTIDCSNCDPKQCERLNCMSSININEVYEEVQKLLALN
ncbi:MAG: ADP-heptose--LPS heptosyltransferase [Ignavibacteria bacterium RBG_13_36_8]|nr:MAG: ADP-heptose--LPS heptosyltransferase [Ignavibacteria bacterium RBG_13_36_8]